MTEETKGNRPAVVNGDNPADFTPEARSRVIGGSEAGIILGLSPKKPMDLFLEKRGITVPEPPSIQMRFGLAMEEFVAQEYLMSTGNGYQLVKPDILVHPDYPWMICHVDRFVTQDDKILFGLECKTANAFMRKDWGDMDTDDIPPSYLAQCQHNMCVTGLDRFDVPVMIGNSELRVYTVERSQAFIDAMIEAEVDFMRRLEENDPPEIDGSEAATKWLTYLHPKDSGEVIELDPDDPIMAIIDHLKDARRTKKEMEALESRAANLIRERMGDATKLLFPGGSISWKNNKDGMKIDWESIAMDFKEVIEQFDPHYNCATIVADHSTVKPGARVFRPTFKKEGE